MTKQMKKKVEGKVKLTDLGRKALFDAYEFSYQVTEAIIESMDEKGISRAELARLMNVSRPYVTQLLEGSVNITFRKFVEVCHALDLNPRTVLARKFANYAPKTNTFKVETVQDVPKLKHAPPSLAEVSGVKYEPQSLNIYQSKLTSDQQRVAIRVPVVLVA